MKKVIRIKNNNVYIGSIRINKKNIKKFAYISAGTFIIISSIAVYKNSKEVISEPIPQPKDDTDTYKPIENTNTYEATYVVQNCDTLSGIVASYQTDPNKMKKIIERITDENHLKNPNSLRAGQTITLYGIPEEYLENFGYTIDYSKTNPEYELEDLSSYIDNAITYIYITDENEQQFADFEAKYSYASNLYNKYKETKDELLFETIIEQYRTLAQDISKLTGLNYDRSIKSHEIVETKGLGSK